MLALVQRRVVKCRRCPRLVRWRERTARTKVRRYAGEAYWGRPVPGFGDPAARLLVVGLAPAAHGGNRTGRMFTGDESGNWLFRALHKAGFASQPTSVGRFDGLALHDCYITAAVRCAPPLNKPLSHELRRCRQYLLDELLGLDRLRVIVGLGRIGFGAALEALQCLGRVSRERKPRFGHAAVYRMADVTVIASYHPSQQNTYTGRLTEPMLDEVFSKANEELRHRTRED